VVARKINGSVWGTGHSLYGQVADGTTVSKRLFTAVTTTDGLPMAGAASVNAGNQHTLVVKTDGTAWASGRDNACQLGIGGLGSQLRIVPMLNVDLTPVSGIASLSGGYGHTVAMGTDNSLWAVGSNVSGQLANGTQDGPCNLEPMIQ
jgi:alpha-tubulin suppressor-like RCC1 family protein